MWLLPLVSARFSGGLGTTMASLQCWAYACCSLPIDCCLVPPCRRAYRFLAATSIAGSMAVAGGCQLVAPGFVDAAIGIHIWCCGWWVGGWVHHRGGCQLVDPAFVDAADLVLGGGWVHQHISIKAAWGCGSLSRRAHAHPSTRPSLSLQCNLSTALESSWWW